MNTTRIVTDIERNGCAMRTRARVCVWLCVAVCVAVYVCVAVCVWLTVHRDSGRL